MLCAWLSADSLNNVIRRIDMNWGATSRAGPAAAAIAAVRKEAITTRTCYAQTLGATAECVDSMVPLTVNGSLTLCVPAPQYDALTRVISWNIKWRTACLPAPFLAQAATLVMPMAAVGGANALFADDLANIVTKISTHNKASVKVSN